MPHLRFRHILPLFQKAVSHSAIVGVFGHRQVGKTTFAEAEVGSYLTFDHRATFREASADAESFLKQISRRASSVGIDECQMIPELFPALKEWVRKRKAPGQFVLTGSVRFTSRKAIRESLTGRVLMLELLPLTISELGKFPLSDFILIFKESQDLERFAESLFSLSQYKDKKIKLVEQYLKCGGLPGICFSRDEKFREDAIKSLLETIFERDIRLVQETSLPTSVIFQFAETLAKVGWRAPNQSMIRRETGLSPLTQKKLLYAFEAVFLIRPIPIEGDRTGHVYLFEDQLEQQVLSQGKLTIEDQMTGLIYRQLRAQYQYRSGESFNPFCYETRGGAMVPLAFHTKGSPLGFIPITAELPTLSQSRSADSFLKHYSSGKIVFVSNVRQTPKALSNRTLLVDISAVV